MSFLDKLESIFGFKFDFSRLKDIHIISDNKIEQKIINNHNNITINLVNVPQDQLPVISKLIKMSLEDESSPVLNDEAVKTIESISKSEHQKDNSKILDFFQDKLTQTDLEILRASLYVKYLSSQKQYSKIPQLKADIIYKYGDRGRNIVNLCNAGYFETMIMPLYEQMEKEPDFSIRNFQKVFDGFIMHCVIAIFVKTETSLVELKKEVVSKIEQNKKYGVHYLNIHGIGQVNIKKIQKLIVEFEDLFTKEPEIESKSGYIVARIFY